MVDKKIIISIVVGIVVVAALGITAYVWFQNKSPELTENEKIELEIREVVESGIESWPLYVKTPDAQYKKFGNDPSCGSTVTGSTDFLDYEKKALGGDVYRLDLSNGQYLVYTPNYNNWDHQKISSLTVQDLRVCSGGWLIPLFATQDKVVWGNITCANVDAAQVNNCLRIGQIIMGYVTRKSL